MLHTTLQWGGVKPTLCGLDSAAELLSGLYLDGTTLLQYPPATILAVSILDPTYRMVLFEALVSENAQMEITVVLGEVNWSQTRTCDKLHKGPFRLMTWFLEAVV